MRQLLVVSHALVILLVSSAAQASFLGDTASFERRMGFESVWNEQTAIVSDTDTEFVCCGSISLEIDVGSNYIHIDGQSVISFGVGGGPYNNTLRIFDLDWSGGAIPSAVSITTAGLSTPFEPSDIRVLPNAIEIDMGGQFTSNTLDILIVVPEPSTALLIGLGLAAIGVMRRAA